MVYSDVSENEISYKQVMYTTLSFLSPCLLGCAYIFSLPGVMWLSPVSLLDIESLISLPL